MAILSVLLSALLTAVLAVGPAFFAEAAFAADAGMTDAERRILEDQRSQQSAPAVRSAMELYDAKQYGAAAERLDTAIAVDPENSEALLLAGLARLRLDDPAATAARWKKFAAVSKDPKLASEVARFNTIVLHEANARYAKEAVANERQLAAQPTSPGTVAIAPFRNAGSAEYAALGKALAAELIDNLTLVPGLEVLERERVNALIEETKLAGTGLVEKGSAVRAGKLLRAGRVGAGSYKDWTASPTHLGLDVALVDVDSGTTIVTAEKQGPATEFYELVPSVAGQLSAALGHSLGNVPTEARTQLMQVHTKSLDAQLAYGKALDALDREDVDAARKACDDMEAAGTTFPLAKVTCDRIPAVWLTLPAVALAVEALLPTLGAAAAVGAGISTTAIALSAGAAAAAVGAGVAVSQSSKGGGGGGSSSSERGGAIGGNNAPALRGVADRSVPAGTTATIDMQCFDPDANSTTIQNGRAAANASFEQTSGNPSSARYRQRTTTEQVGQGFDVAFTCTDDGSPPASDTKTARINVLAPGVPTPVPEPTTVPSCEPLLIGCQTNPECCSGSCAATNASGAPVCCTSIGGSCSNAEGCCRPAGGSMECVSGHCCLGVGSPCSTVGPDPSCCGGTCGSAGCDTNVAVPTPTPIPPTPTPLPATPTPAGPTPTPCLGPGEDGCIVDSDCCGSDVDPVNRFCCTSFAFCSFPPGQGCGPCGC